MNKKFALLLLTVVMTASLTACIRSDRSSNASHGVISPGMSGKRPEITILYYPVEGKVLGDDYVKSYIRDFEKQYGVRVNLLGIGEGDYSEGDRENFEKELAAKLYLKDGPELIFYENRSVALQSLIEQNAVLDLKNRISNISKIYPSLLVEKLSYVPVGIFYNSYVLNKKAVEDLGMPEIQCDWTIKDYRRIREKWLSKSKRPFDMYEYCDIYDDCIGSLHLYDSQTNKAIVNTPEVRKAVNDIRAEIYSGKYILDKGYTYKNYYNMFMERQSDEYKKHLEYRRSEAYKLTCLCNVHVRGGINLLLAKDNDRALFLENAIPMPEYKDRTLFIDSIGFVVNKNGKNIELALELINGMLDDEAQTAMFNEPYEKRHYYPVNKDIEEQIREQLKGMESEKKLDKKSLELSEYALSQIKNGKVMLDAYGNEKEGYLSYSFRHRIIKFVFADKAYSDEELGKELQKLEDELNIWLNE